ncbi:MAG: tRNA-intron lyase [Candidatus Pacearchaeota archaeon]
MEKIKAYFSSGKIFSNTKEAFSLLEESCFGEKDGEKVFYSSFESVFLLEEGKMILSKINEKEMFVEELIAFFEKKDKSFSLKYLVFKDLRNKGYVVKSALKFGADFRVYEKGKKVSEEHAKWLVSVFSEHEKISFKDFFAKNRVAHSVNKILLLAIVDDENDVSYYENLWRRL